MRDKDIAQAELAKCGIEPGQIYRHYKGGNYVVIAVVLKENTLEPLVIYRSNAMGMGWARTMENWNELVVVDPGELIPRMVPRFTRVLD